MTYSLNILHSPSSVPQSKLLHEVFKFCLGKGFGENIGNIFVRRDILHVDIAVLDSLANVVITDIDVFGSCMELIVLREHDCTLVVAIKGCRFFKGQVKLAENCAEPNEFLHSMSLRHVFGLSTRESDNWLLLQAPSHSTITHMENVP
jgi:hypothetical protein